MLIILTVICHRNQFVKVIKIHRNSFTLPRERKQTQNTPSECAELLCLEPLPCQIGCRIGRARCIDLDLFTASSFLEPPFIFQEAFTLISLEPPFNDLFRANSFHCWCPEGSNFYEYQVCTLGMSMKSERMHACSACR